VGGLPVARLHPDGALESLYVYGALAHVPDLILRGGRTYRLVTDHLGSPRLVVDVETGAVAQRLDYDVHGRVLVDTSPGFQPFAFAGGLYDPDTGLVRFDARDYDPEVGRWTAKDPAGFAGGDTNLYAYAYGDPVNYVDPNGELAFLAPFIIAAVKGALAGAALGGGIALASELLDSGGDIDCVDWRTVGAGAADGALWGAAGGALLQGAGRAYTGLRNLRNASRGAATGKVNPLEGTTYTGKVRAQMRQNPKTGRPDNHGFPLQVDNSAGLGRQTTIKGGDGVTRAKIELDGSYNGKQGTFEWIIEPNGTVNHRLFVPKRGGAP
jgi:RHS repeat-associated protein